MTSARIMIVEDEPVTAEDLQEALTEMGYTVTAVVSTAAEAIQEAQRTSVDLVVMDIHIQGDVDGIDAARTIRQRFDIPAVYLTAHADADTLSRARLAEPLGYIIKPYQEPELQATIEMALHKHSIDRQSSQNRAQLVAALEAIGQGMISVNAGGSITSLNPAAEAWTGWKQAEALGKGIEEVFRTGSAAAAAALSRALSGEELVGLEEPCTLTSRAGEKRAIGGSIAPVRDHHGVVTGTVIVFGVAADDAAPALPAPGGQATVPEGSTMVVESAAMRKLVDFARRVAASEISSVLIEGESGTGKDVLAKYVHYRSRRRSEAFLAINCAAIPEPLLESELFGYEKGAFTDARQQKRGILEMASGGTVFLDEIGDMPLALQAKLLRVLEEQVFRRLGGLRDVQVDLRIVAATNRDLREAIRQGRFRLDLYYRLNVIRLVIPPLRERRDDILPLAARFVQLLNQKYKRHIAGISPRAADVLLAHDWPGNARELRNLIERAMVLEESEWVQPASLGSLEDSEGDTTPVESMPLNQAERTMLLRALEKAEWNQSKAARVLGISRDTLRYRIKKYDLKPTETPEI